MSECQPKWGVGTVEIIGNSPEPEIAGFRSISSAGFNLFVFLVQIHYFIGGFRLF